MYLEYEEWSWKSHLDKKNDIKLEKYLKPEANPETRYKGKARCRVKWETFYSVKARISLQYNKSFANTEREKQQFEPQKLNYNQI